VNIVPSDEMTVEATKPHSRLKPPLTETLAIVAALVIRFFLKARLHVDELKDVNREVFIIFGSLAQTHSPLHKQRALDARSVVQETGLAAVLMRLNLNFRFGF